MSTYIPVQDCLEKYKIELQQLTQLVAAHEVQTAETEEHVISSVDESGLISALNKFSALRQPFIPENSVYMTRKQFVAEFTDMPEGSFSTIAELAEKNVFKFLFGNTVIRVIRRSDVEDYALDRMVFMDNHYDMSQLYDVLNKNRISINVVNLNDYGMVFRGGSKYFQKEKVMARVAEVVKSRPVRTPTTFYLEAALLEQVSKLSEVASGKTSPNQIIARIVESRASVKVGVSNLKNIPATISGNRKNISTVVARSTLDRLAAVAKEHNTSGTILVNECLRDYLRMRGLPHGLKELPKQEVPVKEAPKVVSAENKPSPASSLFQIHFSPTDQKISDVIQVILGNDRKVLEMDSAGKLRKLVGILPQAQASEIENIAKMVENGVKVSYCP